MATILDSEYRDRGCAAGGPSCLVCPLARCVYDTPGGIRVVRNAPRNEAIRQAKRDGLTGPEIAAAHGVSLRSVWRILGT